MSYCGTVSIVGRPNVGKSTLLNHLIGQKLSITAHKPQTTRHSILGIHTAGEHQILYVDTPGIHVSGQQRLNRVLNRTASNALHGVDLVLLLVQAMSWGDDDQRAWDLVAASEVPFLLVVNKVDQVKRKEDLLPWLAELPQHERCEEVFLISAKKGNGVDALETAITSRLPEAPWQFDADELTDRSSTFLAAEAVREQLTRYLSQELPYALTVEVEQFVETPELLRIGAVIWVGKESHKGIVIGKGGARLKEVGRRSRESMEALFGQKVFLELWVRVKSGWADDERALQSLGYEG